MRQIVLRCWGLYPGETPDHALQPTRGSGRLSGTLGASDVQGTMKRSFSMSTEENKSLVRRYVEQILNRGNMAVADELLAPDYKRYTSPTAVPLTVDVQKQRLAGIRAAFPDWHLTVEDMIAEGDRVAFRATIRGTHMGVFQNVAPTGKQVTVSALDIVRIEKGKFIEHWGGPDLLNLLQQLGAVVAPGTERK
jgi:predicted ester cyclase